MGESMCRVRSIPSVPVATAFPSWAVAIAVGCAAIIGHPADAAGILVDFEDIALGGGTPYLDGSYVDPSLDDPTPQGGGSGTSRAVPFVSRGASFSNWYDRGWFTWTGFAITGVNDPTPSSPVYDNQYSAAAGPAFEGTNYAIAYLSSYGLAPVIDLPAGYDAASVRITNTTYAKAVILDGNAPYARRFGDDPSTSGVVETNFPDHFSLFLTGYSGANATGTVVGSVESVLADYRFSDDALDFVVDEWTQVDLSGLAGARSIALTWFSTDTSTYDGVAYINTPTYVAIDNLALVPEPSAIVLAACGVAIAGAAVRRRVRKP